MIADDNNAATCGACVEITRDGTKKAPSSTRARAPCPAGYIGTDSEGYLGMPWPRAQLAAAGHRPTAASTERSRMEQASARSAPFLRFLHERRAIPQGIPRLVYVLHDPAPMDAQDRWNDELLEAMRGQSDPAADEAIDALAAHHGPGVVEPVLEALERGDEIPPSALPEEIRNFLAVSAALPPWADPARLRLAAAFFEARAPEIGVVLACHAIPAGHAAAGSPEARPAPRREILRDVLDTARSVGDLMADGALEPGGDGIEAAQRIRLRHAALRHRRARHAGAVPLRPRSPRPLDQEAMVGWLMSLSHVVLDGLAKLGLEAAPAEADAYLHAWNVAGHLMGVRDVFLPSHPEDAGALWHAVQRRKLPASPEARAYTTALVEMMEDIVSDDALDALPSAMMRHLMGDAMADGLGVPASAFSPQLFRSSEVLAQLASRILDDSPLVAQIARRLGAYFRGVERGRPGEAAPPSSRHPLLSEPPAASAPAASGAPVSA